MHAAKGPSFGPIITQSLAPQGIEALFEELAVQHFVVPAVLLVRGRNPAQILPRIRYGVSATGRHCAQQHRPNICTWASYLPLLPNADDRGCHRHWFLVHDALVVAPILNSIRLDVTPLGKHGRSTTSPTILVLAVA